MDSRPNTAHRPTLNMQQASSLQTVANGFPNRTQTSASNSPLSSAPPTPNLNTSTTPRRPSHPATSPLIQSSPQVIRRTSSAVSLGERTAASPNPMRRKISRTSLGAPVEDGDKRPTPKRSISNLISGLREAHARMEAIEEPVPLTAPQIASQHFARQLASHSQSDVEPETVVILHDACYGHRYSRLKTTKSTLSMIVERPERIHASVLGASTAYVRLGEHYAGGKNAPRPENREVIGPPFKIRRTARSMDITSPYVTSVHGTAWMLELQGMCKIAGEKLAGEAKELSRSSTPTEPEKRKLHEGDLYLSSESLNAFEGALGGVADAVDAVFDPKSQTKRAFVAIRPPGHHCSADYPSGFCWLNNVHVGIEYAAQTYGLTHAAILDFDLHHGDGSQAITWERNSKNNAKRLNAKPNSKLKLSPDIGYYSLHDINSYPCEMGDDEKVQAASLCIEDAHGQSVWNVHLQPWKTEKDFWELYETKYRVLLEKARVFLKHHTTRLKAEAKAPPKAALFISAGFDASEWEGAGMQRHKVNVPTEFYARFTRDVVQLAHEEGLGCDGRVISVLEGGYSDRALCSGVLSHLSGLCASSTGTDRPESSGMDGLDQMMRGLGINGMGSASWFAYDKTWWSPANLTALEMKINPPPPMQGKKTRVGQQPTYATPTESFAYKVVDADKFARSISGTMRDVQQPARPPTPPAPEVDWVIATQELSKLLIPTDRQTKSCNPEELAGPKIKKEHVAIAQTVGPVEPRQLRDRKSKGPGYAGSTHSDETESVRSVSRSSRRQTIAELPSASAQPEPTHQRRASRRLSAGSVLSSVGGDLDTDPPPVPAIPPIQARQAPVMQPPHGPARDVQVKKMRAPVKKEATSSAPVSPKRVTKAPTRLPGPANTGAAQTNGDLDALTAGMKKVTLKVGSKEEHDRKQKEKVDAERRARGLKAAETRKANAAAKKAATNTAKENPAPITKTESDVVAHDAHDGGVPLPQSIGVDSSEIYPVASQPALDPQDAAPAIFDPTAPGYSLNAMYGQSTLQSQPAMFYQSPQSAPPPEQSYNMSSPAHAIPTPPSQQTSNGTVYPAMPAGVPGQTQPLVAQQTLWPKNPAHASPKIEPKSSRAQPRSPNGERLPTWSSTGVIPFA